MIVARIERRNTSTTSVTSTTDSIRVNCTSAIEALMVPVRSDTIVMSMPAGSEVLSLASSARMRLTVATTLAPGWR